MFNKGEQEVFNNLPKGIENVKKKLGLDNLNELSSNNSDFSQQSSNEKSMQRVLTLPGISVEKHDDLSIDKNTDNVDYSGYNLNSDNYNNQAASSFVLIIGAVIALIVLVTIVTLGILKYIGV